MSATNYEIVSLLIMGVLFGELLYQLMLIGISKRTKLHLLFCGSFLSLMFVLGFNPHFGMFQGWWPGGYDINATKGLLFAAVNIFVLCTNYIFALLPKFRKVNRRILYLLCSVVLAVCLLYWLTPDEYHDIIVAVIAGVQIVYLCYVMFHLLRTVHIEIFGTMVIPALFLLYIAFIVWTAIHALQNRNEIFTHFFVGAAFPVALSFIGAFRSYLNFIKMKDAKSVITPEVTQRIDELEFANTSKDKFFSIIAHDLKSPIGGIKTISEIYSDEAAQSKDNHAVELAAALRESIDGLCMLLDDLLTWSRSQSGALQFLPTYVDIETLIDNVKKVTKPLCDTKSIALKVTINERDKLYGDPNMLRTVLRNLITNAVKYSYANSVIKLEFDAEGGYYSIIRVTDNGIGMSKDELNALFQIDKLNTRPGTNREAGNGLGLIICHDFIEKHGGTITVETEEDLGTTFVVKIPYARYINKVNA